MAVIVDVGPQRQAECLRVLREGFATVTAEYGITAANTPSNPAFWTGRELAQVAARTQLFAIEEEGGLVGCAFVGASPSRPGTWVLRHLAVLPEARHRGHGEALVAEAVRRALAAGASTLRIGIVAANTRLSDWYRALGFRTVEAGVRHPGLVFEVDHLEYVLQDAIST